MSRILRQFIPDETKNESSALKNILKFKMRNNRRFRHILNGFRAFTILTDDVVLKKRLSKH